MSRTVVDNFEILAKIHLPDYDIMVVPGDGDCMYRSILQSSKSLEKAPGTVYDDTHQGIIGSRGFRKKVVDIINSDTSIEADMGRSIARQLKSEMVRSIKSGDWGTGAIASMISKYYGTPISIVAKTTNEIVNGVDDLKGIILYYDSTKGSEHYDWLRLKVKYKM